MRVDHRGLACWLCILVVPAIAAELAAASDYRLFDAGGAESALEPGAVRLSIDLGYDEESGFGWVKPPTDAFARPELTRSRGPLTADGVSGEELEFRVDVPPGRWWVTAWLEAGIEEQGLPAVTANGQRLKTGWQPFRPNVEPPKGPPRLYRILHQQVDCSGPGLSLRLTGKKPVRLLGFSLIRAAASDDRVHGSVAESLLAAGRYDSSASLEEIMASINEATKGRRGDPWLELQSQRLRWLMLAEELVAARGWRWADHQFGLGMFDRQYQAIAMLDGLLGVDVEEQGPLAGRARFLRGRALYWLNRERGGEAERAGGERDLGILRGEHPEDQLLGMYLGQQVALPCPCDALQHANGYEAPRWSTLQLEALCRMRRIAHWWTLERQSETGEFGGKYGDDVELLRWWAPLCLSGDAVALRGWQRLADGVWDSGKVDRGYSLKLSDVEHAAELVADTAPMMVVYQDDPLYQERLMGSSQLFRDLWTSHTPQGRRYFRSAWFSSTEIDTTGRRGRDVEYNTRAAQAVRYLAWRRRDPEATELLHEWASAWAHAAMRTDKGKPKGVVPASVRFSDEAINGDGPNWYEADMYWHYYDWDTYCGSLILDQLFFVYFMTGDAELLEPMHHCLALVQSEADKERGEAVPGSASWAADKLSRHQTFWRVVEQWRFRTGDTRWDRLIRRYGSPYGRYRLSGDEEQLYPGLEYVLGNLRYNLPLKTSEALYTDRVRVRGWEVLKAMLTGDGVTNSISPHLWVSWEGTDEYFTALVTETGPGLLKAEVFSHSEDAAEVEARLWKLEPGRYRLTRRDSGGAEENSTHEITELGQRIAISLPPRQLVAVEFERLP